MPAAAVIPAPIAYIKVVAVKKLVVELESTLGGVGLGSFPLCGAGLVLPASFCMRIYPFLGEGVCVGRWF